MNANFSPQETNLYNLLAAAGVDTDVAIDAIHAALFEDTCASPTLRQMRIGACISRINGKLDGSGYRIKPGLVKRTYRLKLMLL